MNIVLLHGSANGAYSWGPVQKALGPLLPTPETRVFAPDMLGYGRAPSPSAAYSMAEEVAHLAREIEQAELGAFHLVAHSLGCMYALHLRRMPRVEACVKKLTLIDPVLVSVLRETNEVEAYTEMEALYHRAMHEDAGAPPRDERVVAKDFVEHWGGRHAWSGIGDKARALITSLVPKVRQEIAVARADATPLAWFTEGAPPARVFIGEHTRLAPRRGAVQIAGALGASLTEVPSAGHMLPLTHPGQVARIILGDEDARAASRT